jgi:hypothetical protein
MRSLPLAARLYVTATIAAGAVLVGVAAWQAAFTQPALVVGRVRL